MSIEAPALEITTLGVMLASRAAPPILEGITLSVPRGGSLGLVGHSGAGKTSLGLAVLGLLADGLRLTAESSIKIAGEELITSSGETQRRARGRQVTMVFQEPANALNPSMTIGRQIEESLRTVEPEAAARVALAADWLHRVGFAAPRTAVGRYPHELSGGQRQRVLLAMAMAPAPAVLIADEPTTALDATVQAQLLDLMELLRASTGTALLLISHDLALVAERCARTAVLDRGRLVEEGLSSAIWQGRRSTLAFTATASRTAVSAPLLVVRDLQVTYASAGGWIDRSGPVVRAVAGVSLEIDRGETLGLIGESGCGKSSLARALVGLAPPSSGDIRFDGRALDHRDRRAAARRIQWIPQDAGASLTPSRTIGELLSELFEVHRLVPRAEQSSRVAQLLEEVGLDPAWSGRRASTLSTGERQRVAIARALAVEPALLVCDEPVASVDAPRREQLLELLESVQRSRGLTLLLISHDLTAVARLASRVAVMYLGRIVEIGPASEVLQRPRMPYTQALHAAIPTGDPLTAMQRIILRGEVPSPSARPHGCAFESRCPHPAKDATCLAKDPALALVAPGHQVACWKVASGG